MRKTRFLPWPVLLLCVNLCLSCDSPSPRINSIDPHIGMMGEILTIYGEHFGETRDESSVSIGGIAPTTSSYIDWTSGRILVRVPEFGESGLVYVHVNGKTSNAALFSNRLNMPQPILGAQIGNGPRIFSVEPSAAMIGSLITIHGQNFGASRESGRVLFAWAAEMSPAAPREASAPSTVAVSETDFGYESWNDREIKVRVPDGAMTGNLEVNTPRGASLPVFFEVSGRPGSKVYKDKRSYAISYSVDIRVAEASSPNTLYLWMPLPKSSASQKEGVLLARNSSPFIENFEGAALYQFKNLRTREAVGVTLSYLVDVYAIETNIRSQSVSPPAQSTLQSIYTSPSSLLPSRDPQIVELAGQITGREQNPLLKARRIYDWLLSEGGIQAEPLAGGALEALALKKADAFMASLLFCSLARAAGIPALPAAGVLVDRSRNFKRHYWAEFWLDGFGWIPVDPVLGAGLLDTDLISRPDSQEYYFGSMDNQRITFSRGEALLSQMDPRSRAVSRQREYAFQTIWEEAAGGLESYSSLWSDIIITGIYVH